MAKRNELRRDLPFCRDRKSHFQELLVEIEVQDGRPRLIARQTHTFTCLPLSQTRYTPNHQSPTTLLAASPATLNDCTNIELQIAALIGTMRGRKLSGSSLQMNSERAATCNGEQKKLCHIVAEGRKPVD
eukprot:1011954-Pleurochrysis_carterae.AAC.3